jgi:hypothetical protein
MSHEMALYSDFFDNDVFDNGDVDDGGGDERLGRVTPSLAA